MELSSHRLQLYIWTCDFWHIKTHGSVLYSPRKQGAHNVVIYWQEEQMSIFHSSIALWCVVPNLLWRCPPLMGKLHSKFKEDPFNYSWDTSNQAFGKFLSFFCTLYKNCCNSQTCTSIWLKFGKKFLGVLRQNLSIKFGVNPIHILKQFYV